MELEKGRGKLILLNVELSGVYIMIVVLDGYNILRYLFPYLKGKLDKQRDIFIKQLGYYKYKKEKDLREIIVVFDAGPFNHATREIKHGVVVIFSGQKSSADDWIINYTKKHSREDVLVVTMDRKIIEECERVEIPTLSGVDFLNIMQSFLLNEPVKELKNRQKDLSEIKKYERIENGEEFLSKKFDQNAIDLMMEQSSFFVGEKEDEVDLRDRKGRSKTLSKREKRLFSKIKKLH